jgi:hypothetical protein
MEYRCETRSVSGFIQRVAVDCVARGYLLYVTGRIPEKKDPRVIDKRIVEKFGLVDKSARHRRKLLGLANVQYIRYRRFFIVIATTYGYHPVFEQEGRLIRDVRYTPIKFAGHSISFSGGHVQVRIELELYLRLKRFLFDNALRRSRAELEQAFDKLRFEAFAPVRSQLLCILRAVNCRRKVAGLELVPSSCLRLYRKYPYRPLIDVPDPAVVQLSYEGPKPRALLLPRRMLVGDNQEFRTDPINVEARA